MCSLHRNTFNGVAGFQKSELDILQILNIGQLQCICIVDRDYYIFLLETHNIR